MQRYFGYDDKEKTKQGIDFLHAMDQNLPLPEFYLISSSLHCKNVFNMDILPLSLKLDVSSNKDER